MRHTVMSLLVASALLVVSPLSAQWLTNGTSIYYNGGKVGIGTSTPFVALHVKDPVNQGVGFFQNPNGLVALGVDASGGYLQADAIDFSFFAGANRVLFGKSSNGYVGMGTTNPTSKLHVVSTAGQAIYGTSTAANAYSIFGYHPTNGAGVVAQSGTFRGLWGYSGSGSAVFGATGTGLAGEFSGNVTVSGTLTKGGGAFKIDHPLDPENKYLYHSFVESPEMMNIYDGIVVLGSDGTAFVTMPDWFEALNRDFRYQLTCVGGYAPVFIASEIAGNQFQIGGGKPGLKVSWLVTGIRHDKFAERNRIPLEEDKSAEDRGHYLHPEAFDQSPERGLPSALNAGPQTRERM